MNRIKAFIKCFMGCGFLAFFSVVAEEIDPTHLSIEALMASQVSTVMRTEQSLSETAAAVYVMTQADIQRAGVTNIPDILRLVPGVQVARIAPGRWAVTTRGFNGRFANKLLVLLNGRMVYSPTYAGVRWENLDLILEDIKRIEVIRGPGASIWGQNAVNGVINIITRHTEESQGGVASITSGNEEQAIASLRYGGAIGTRVNYRVFGKFVRRDSLVGIDGEDTEDHWRGGLGGFRIDWLADQGDRVMIEGSGFGNKTHNRFLLMSDPLSSAARKSSEHHSGVNVQARWAHDFSVASTIKTQVLYDYFCLIDESFGSEKNHTLDIDLQHDIALTKAHYFNWGVRYRWVSSGFFAGIFSTVEPTYQALHFVSAFIQDQATFFEGALRLTFGAKFQYYTLSGWDIQPSARLMWKFHPEHRLWLAFSRSIRVPSRGETAYGLKSMPLSAHSPLRFTLRGNANLDRELVYSYELGYRGWMGEYFSWDIAAFYNNYQNLMTPSLDRVDLSHQLSISFENNAQAQSWGIEVATEWRPIDPLRLQLSYSFLHIKAAKQVQPDSAPNHQFSLQSSYDISSTWTIDAWVRYVDSLLLYNRLLGTTTEIASYVGIDLRIAWQPMPSLELSLVGQNLNKRQHIELVDEVFAYSKQVERSFFVKVKWLFE